MNEFRGGSPFDDSSPEERLNNEAEELMRQGCHGDAVSATPNTDGSFHQQTQVGEFNTPASNVMRWRSRRRPRRSQLHHKHSDHLQRLPDVF